ncbi:MAG TPA: PQQ-dependent sugar dehydrogenase [Pyrinomonadaceae bacterium]|jgi:glucose/arabinose dehydrogenase
MNLSSSRTRRRRSPLPFIFASFILCCCAAFETRAATVPAGFTDTLVAGDLSNATAMAIAPDGRIFVCQQGGALRVVKNGALLATPFLTVTVSASGERGLLGVAFDPNFNTNGFVYIYYTATTPAIHNRVSRFTANGDVAVAGSELVLLDLDNLSAATNHNGGAMHFGPDGKLYIAVGENATPSNSQTLSNLLGKMLRINADGSLPTDNPFFNTAAGKNRAIWALGLRNPYTFAFQPGTGRMFINDVGQNAVEEINDGISGSNYGWPTCEGACANPNFRNPLFQYGHGFTATTGCAITGGAFYNPATTQFPASYTGKYFFADFCSNWIRLFDPSSGTATDFLSGASSPVDLQVSADGSLYYLQRGANGQLRRIQYPAGQTPPSIVTHPQSRSVAAGQPVTFTVSATGSTPLQYQWQRNNVNIPGANSESYSLEPATFDDDGAQFRCVVTNAFGSATSNSAKLIVTGSNTAPVAQIDTPPAGTLYNAGDTINYSGTGTDRDDGTLPASAFTWQVDFHHDTHTHPFLPATTGATGGSFLIPTTGETAANVFYRIHLTVRDSGGLTHTVSRDVTPRTALVTLQTSPAGLQVTLDGQPKADGYAEPNVVGIQRTLGVPSPQTLNGVSYNFVSWSDGGAATHNINVPAANTTYTAVFARAGSAREVLITEYRLDGPGGLRDEFVELYNNTNEAITVSTSDGSAGWALVTGRDAAGGAGVALETYHVIPNGTVIPARAHYLVAGSGYSLGSYGGINRALGDALSQGDLSGDDAEHPFRGVALFRTADANNYTNANRLDAVGGACADARLSEGRVSGLCRNVGTAASPAANYSLVRKQPAGVPQDTDNNADDFTLVAVESPLPSAAVGANLAAELGAPGAENLNSPTQHNATIKASLIDPQAAATSPPNRVRAGTPVPNGQFGTLTIRRRFVNKTGRTVLALRFRLTGITTLGTPAESSPQADLRATSSSDTQVQTTAGGMLTVKGTILEQPPAQHLGGGLNSTLVVPLTGGALIPNASIDVQFVLGVQQEGAFRFFVNVEALTQPIPTSGQKGAEGKFRK